MKLIVLFIVALLLHTPSTLTMFNTHHKTGMAYLELWKHNCVKALRNSKKQMLTHNNEQLEKDI